jgi:DNA-binding transcriptional LysR family regulator
MNTRFLETLVVLSRLKSFRETAQVLHTTQAAASQRIAALEDELGVFLVDRSNRTLTLTPMGEQVVRQAERMLALERELKLATQPDAPPAGRVRIGVIETVVHTWLTPLIHGITRRFPAVDPDITVEPARNLREQFRQHKLDLLIQNDPVEEAAGNVELEVTPLSRFPIRWIARPDVWPTQEVLALEDLERIPVLTYVRTSSPHAHVRALFAGREAEPRICSFPSVQSIVQLVKEGFGVAAIPPIFVQREIEAGDLKLCEGPALPPLVVTVTRPRESSHRRDGGRHHHPGGGGELLQGGRAAVGHRPAGGARCGCCCCSSCAPRRHLIRTPSAPASARWRSPARRGPPGCAPHTGCARGRPGAWRRARPPRSPAPGPGP